MGAYEAKEQGDSVGPSIDVSIVFAVAYDFQILGVNVVFVIRNQR